MPISIKKCQIGILEKCIPQIISGNTYEPSISNFGGKQKLRFFKMSKENCFSHLKKRFDEKSEEWQKTWDFLPDTVSLADKVLEELKLVGAMEEVITDSNCFSTEISKLNLPSTIR